MKIRADNSRKYKRINDLRFYDAAPERNGFLTAGVSERGAAAPSRPGGLRSPPRSAAAAHTDRSGSVFCRRFEARRRECRPGPPMPRQGPAQPRGGQSRARPRSAETPGPGPAPALPPEPLGRERRGRRGGRSSRLLPAPGPALPRAARAGADPHGLHPRGA